MKPQKKKILIKLIVENLNAGARTTVINEDVTAVITDNLAEARSKLNALTRNKPIPITSLITGSENDSLEQFILKVKSN